MRAMSSPAPARPALQPPAPRQPEAPRILIVRISALGDIVFASSLLDALKRRWPKAQIDWLAQAGLAGILQDDPRVNEVIALPAETLRSPRRLWQLRRELRRRHYDWVLDAQGLAKSRLLAFLAGGWRVGFASKEPGALLMHQLLPKGGPAEDISSEYRYLASALSGVPAAPPRLTVSATAAARVDGVLAELGLARGFIALCPFTTRPQKHWHEAHWPQLAAQLAAAGAPPLLMFGGPADQEVAARLIAASPVTIINRVGQTRIAELPAWLQAAGLVIGVDTGLTHIGIAVQAPVVALFGSTRPYTRLEAGDDGSRLRVLYEALPCAPCRRHPSCEGRFDCMRALTPGRVAAQALQLLRRPAQ